MNNLIYREPRCYLAIDLLNIGGPLKLGPAFRAITWLGEDLGIVLIVEADRTEIFIDAQVPKFVDYWFDVGWVFDLNLLGNKLTRFPVVSWTVADRDEPVIGDEIMIGDRAENIAETFPVPVGMPQELNCSLILPWVRLIQFFLGTTDRAFFYGNRGLITTNPTFDGESWFYAPAWPLYLLDYCPEDLLEDP